MAYHVTIVPPASAGVMSAQYLEDFITLTVPTSGSIIQILETGPRPVIVWDDGA